MTTADFIDHLARKHTPKFDKNILNLKETEMTAPMSKSQVIPKSEKNAEVDKTIYPELSTAGDPMSKTQ